MQVVDSEGYLKVKLVGGPVGPFVPYTGATANVNLGEYEIKAGQFTLDTSPTGTAVVGTTRWNDSIGSSETTLKGGSVILKNGVDLVARVVNKVTPNTTLTKANYTAVRISGAQGQRLAVAYAQANNDANSADTIGLVAETIPTNQEGFIITVGNLEGINTTGALQGETWADGDVLYLSPTTPGAITNIKPNGSTGHIIVIGYVEYAHAINGKIYVKIMNGWELDELHNVYINPATLANNNILQYDSADQLWKNKVLSTGITIGSTAIASGSVGRILFEGAGNVVQESAGLTYNDTTKAFTLSGNQNGQTKATISNTTSGTSSRVDFILTSDGGAEVSLGKFSSTTTSYKILAERDSFLYNNPVAGDIAILNDFTTGRIKLTAGGSSTAQMTLFSTGNVLINTTTDAGFRLDVNGTARVSGTLTLNNTSGTNRSTDIRTSNSIDNFPTTTFYPSSGTNVGQSFQVIPRGTGFSAGIKAQFAISGTDTIADGTNFEAMVVRATGSAFTFSSGKGGTGTIRPMLFSAGFLDGVTNPNQLWLYSTGNVGINTTTDAGFRLDVNGTARVQGDLSSTGIITAQSRFTQLGSNANTFPGIINHMGAAQSVSGLNTTRICANTDLSVGFAGGADASAVIEARSTTKGFLPPRMTTTQKNAIASPVAGLMVYDTTLNVISYYNGTMWI